MFKKIKLIDYKNVFKFLINQIVITLPLKN